MGRNCVKEVLRYSPERIIKIFTANPDSELKMLSENHHIPLTIVDKGELSRMVNSDSHQSIAALLKDKPSLSLDDYLKSSQKKESDLVLLLDSINDPQNLGALLRAAECFGVGAVMWSKNRGCDITPTVSKASVGATELVDIVKISNLVEAAKTLKEEGYQVIAAEVGKEAHSLYQFNFPAKAALIVGSEGPGVRPLLSKQADHQVYIPMLGTIDSLNVSQATAVFLSFWQLGRS